MTTSRIDLAHLHRRLGFGATAAELDAAEAAGWDATLTRLLHPGTADPGVTATPRPALDPVRITGRPASSQQRAEAQQLRAQAQELTAWWLARMVAVRNPFSEKLTLFWHGHFATSIAKVRQAAWMSQQNEVLRSLGQGNFYDLTMAVGQGPAMLIWLDTVTDTAANPNENFARELMELFTVGVGNYTEQDVRAGARCFTGWSFDRATGQFRVRPRAHDSGVKTFLGHTGDLDGQAVVQILTALPASSRWVTYRLWNRFVAPTLLTDPVIAAHAPAAPVNLAALLTTMFTSPVFRAQQGTLVAEPIEYVVGALRQLNVAPTALRLSATLAGLGQVPFAPPDVGGWPAGAGWLTSASALARLTFARAVTRVADLSAVGDVPAAQRIPAVMRLLSLPGGFGPQTTAALAAVGGDPAALVTFALVSPEYVIR